MMALLPIALIFYLQIIVKADIERGSSANGDFLWFRWPNKTMVYEYDPDVSQYERSKIDAAQRQIAYVTCIRFKPRQKERTYTYITNKKENCYSLIGRDGGKMPLNLQRIGCINNGIIIHMLFHALGYMHKGLTDKNDYIATITENLDFDKGYNFKKISEIKADETGMRTVIHLGDFDKSKAEYPPNVYNEKSKLTIDDYNLLKDMYCN